MSTRWIILRSKTASAWRKRRGGAASVPHAPSNATTSLTANSSHQQLLTRSIDKVFEEAELSGVLILAGRQLREFPINFAMKYDISDVILIDLSDNRLSELPPCICELSSMETLKISKANLRSLPINFHTLESLTFLDLSGNQLTSLPISLFSLRLQVLLLSGNRLEEIPREIRQLADSLTEMDASCNRLKRIPADFGLLKSLRVLNLRDNQLKQLPSEISRLNLHKLDISANEISELPSELRFIRSLIELCVESNPIVSPPAKLCSKGCEHAFKWLHARSNINADATRLCSVNGSAINATIRRGKMEKSSDSSFGRVERRGRSSRFNTLGGIDSGYVSTTDDQRQSHCFEASSAAGCLFDTRDSYRSRYSVDKTADAFTSSNLFSEIDSEKVKEGSLLSEVMSAYARNSQQTGKTSMGNVSDEFVVNRSQTPQQNVSTTPTSGLYTPTAQRPQAIVPPMTSKLTYNNENNQPSTNSSTATLPEYGASVSIQKVMDESNNNRDGLTQFVDCTVECGIKCCYRTAAPVPDRLVISTSGENHSFALDFKPNNWRVADSQRRETQEMSFRKILSPVIEVPPSASIQARNPIDDSTIEAVTSSNIVSSGDSISRCSITTPFSPTIAVASNLKISSTIPTFSSRKSSASSSPRVPTSQCCSALKKPSARPSLSSSGSSTTVLGGSKISKTRDSIGLARNNYNGKIIKKSTIDLNTDSSRCSQRSSIRTSSQPMPGLVESMRKAIEERLSTELPRQRDRLSASLADGAHLCNFANQIRPRVVTNIYTHNSIETPISSPRCRRNAENFVNACRRIGVPEASLCSSLDILERRNLLQIAKTVIALNKLSTVVPVVRNIVESESRKVTNV